eukprot:Nk52_evm13s554 gene=Nk52_evmTU13s554
MGGGSDDWDSDGSGEEGAERREREAAVAGRYNNGGYNMPIGGRFYAGGWGRGRGGRRGGGSWGGGRGSGLGGYNNRNQARSSQQWSRGGPNGRDPFEHEQRRRHGGSNEYSTGVNQYSNYSHRDDFDARGYGYGNDGRYREQDRPYRGDSGGMRYNQRGRDRMAGQGGGGRSRCNDGRGHGSYDSPGGRGGSRYNDNFRTKRGNGKSGDGSNGSGKRWKGDDSSVKDEEEEPEAYTVGGFKTFREEKIDRNHLAKHGQHKVNQDTTKLPIHEHRDAIIKALDENQFVVVAGDTGSGKTTQVPKYIYEHCLKTGQECNIVCTQPKRVAAISISKRVLNEVFPHETIGESVGYKIGNEQKWCPETKITFETVGVFLQQTITKKKLKPFTHIILDEVHERTQETDFALLLARKLARDEPNVKVIAMSATMDSSKFADYLCTGKEGEKVPAAILNVGGKPHDVVDVYMDDVRDMLDFDVNSHSLSFGRFDDRIPKIIVEFIKDIERKEEKSKSESKGAVLVFLPGKHEINQCKAEILKEFSESVLWVLTLHAEMSASDQELAFCSPEGGERKVILSTNIAESSITVPDVVYVIDSCLEKVIFYDDQTKYKELRLQSITQASAQQRRGRAGRVQAGMCYRCCSRKTYSEFSPYSLPEILRAPADRLVLQVKTLDMDPPRQLLKQALDSPKEDAIEAACLDLKEMGGLTRHCGTADDKYDGDITLLGSLMNDLPCDFKITKLICIGHMLGYTDEALLMGSFVSSSKSLFRIRSSRLHRGPSQEDRMKCFRSVMRFSKKSGSDCVTAMTVLEEYMLAHLGGMNARELKAWANDRSLDDRRIDSCLKHLLDVKKRMEQKKSVGIKCIEGGLVEIYCNFAERGVRPRKDELEFAVTRLKQRGNRDDFYLSLIIAGAFYPQYFKGYYENKTDMQTFVKKKVNVSTCTTVTERFSTVFFKCPFVGQRLNDAEFDQLEKNIRSALLRFCYEEPSWDANLRIQIDDRKVEVVFPKPASDALVQSIPFAVWNAVFLGKTPEGLQLESPYYNDFSKENVKGVGHPLLLTYKPVTKANSAKPSRLEMDSCNICSFEDPNNVIRSCSMYDDPKNCDKKFMIDEVKQPENLLISCYCTASQNTALNLRHTTAFSLKHPMCLPLVSMIFAPHTEFRLESSGRYIVGMITGCGGNDLDVNDIECNFANSFELEDIEDINTIRSCMSSFFDQRLERHEGETRCMKSKFEEVFFRKREKNTQFGTVARYEWRQKYDFCTPSNDNERLFPPLEKPSLGDGAPRNNVAISRNTLKLVCGTCKTEVFDVGALDPIGYKRFQIKNEEQNFQNLRVLPNEKGIVFCPNRDPIYKFRSEEDSLILDQTANLEIQLGSGLLLEWASRNYENNFENCKKMNIEMYGTERDPLPLVREVKQESMRPSSFFCDACNISFPSASEQIAHNETDEHKAEHDRKIEQDLMFCSLTP